MTRLACMQTFSMDLHVKVDDIKTFRGRVQASHEIANDSKEYGSSIKTLASVMKTRVSVPEHPPYRCKFPDNSAKQMHEMQPFSLDCVFIRGICHLRYQS